MPLAPEPHCRARILRIEYSLDDERTVPCLPQPIEIRPAYGGVEVGRQPAHVVVESVTAPPALSRDCRASAAVLTSPRPQAQPGLPNACRIRRAGPKRPDIPECASR
jgi:hypothetical protein